MLKLCCTSRASTDPLNADIEEDPVQQMQFLRDDLEPSDACFITAKMTEKADRFIIDVTGSNVSKDIVLRLGFRASTISMGRNARISGKWSEEETDLFAPVLLKRGHSFEVQIFFTKENIYIAFDGLHAATFSSTYNLCGIRSIECRGGIRDVVIERRHIKSYPLRRKSTPHVVRLDIPATISELSDNSSSTYASSQELTEMEYQFLPIPYYATFAEGFFEQGSSIIVAGIVHPEVEAIRVALQWKDITWPQPEVPLQVDIRFVDSRGRKIEEPEVFLDSCTVGTYCGEVKSNCVTGLRPSSDLYIVILRTIKGYDVRLNGKHVAEYPYRRSPKFITTCLVQGGICLDKVYMKRIKYISYV